MKRMLGLIGLLFAMAGPGWAAGLIIVHESDFWPPPQPPHLWPPPRPIPPPRPLPPPVWAPLEVTYVRADAKIKDQVATTSIEEEFFNPNARQLEGTFLFPVPKGAQITKFAMEINGKPVAAELLAADKARGLYEDIVRKLRDPALLEYAGRDLFKVRIFPIEPNSKKRVTLSYSQVLKADGGLVNYVFPLNTEKFSAKPLRNVSLKLELDSKRPLKSLYSPSHKVEIKRHGAQQATVGFEAAEVQSDTDFQLYYSMEAGDIGLNLLTSKTPGEDGYFLLLAAPAVDLKDAKVLPKDITFVLDTSGSMAGAKLDQAKKALQFCVENLNREDRFEILRFATEVEPLFDRLAEATEENRAKARAFIQELKPIGGTAIDDALRKALAVCSETRDRPSLIVFLTDGKPTVGVTDDNQILEHVTREQRTTPRIFCFGIGNDVNTHLLDKITEQTKAFSQYVLPEEDLELKVSSFYTKIKEPVLANPTLKFPDGVRAGKVYPAPLPDLFKGEQLIVVGRYSGAGEGALQLEGSVNDQTKKFAEDVKFPESASDHEFIPRLWATRRIGYLLDEIRLRGESQELKDEVTDLARKYGIVTPYTAYLILEDERQRGVASNLQSLPALERDVKAKEESARLYSQFRREQAGAAAVAGAQSSMEFKQADGADALNRGVALAMRPQAQPAASAPAGANTRVPGLSAGGVGGGVSGAPMVVTGAAARLVEQSRQTRYAGGRAFYKNGAQWIDAEIQKHASAKQVRIAFDSAEYYDLIQQHPMVTPWLSLGRNVRFYLEGAIYEIGE